uniref:Glycerol kinase n=1 Tax=Chlamydomonas leiostraca TaxID=1034604 RepID=A0A7S0RG04_9CHLO|mmetsp:Transcript_21911/g.55771  ORF Transcript_21911/g.55771 Transcript_21911/m.55771 type:complete len:835 (+) Transcript_21911:147-2651(+)|eukprot:CAMPEP_0202859752 /NCGR_PEP_ID=MMETSP1391-20130828/1735_1 /ASSEMBLY_ACC=CAM_ASM_000867 /TAXON_ID=1034604 /ORGANISM="Chlamydomonas leiostraca, Strain SAG 11-49" /LENGTH=834 /DNA_ID=CAMNT_0049538821 /DNA_START=56 /DNA_END=2560 /DNA_ORIENTATION=-
MTIANGNGHATKPFLLAIDGGTESIRAAVFDLQGHLKGSHAVEYETQFPRPGWAEQQPEDWWQGMGKAIKGALAAADVQPADIAAMSVDTTCCTVVALDAGGKPLRPALLWMDMRSAAEAGEAAATRDPAIRVNSGGEGPVSAEWMVPKSLWIKRHEPHVWAAAATICEYQDFINHRLTGVMCASVNNAAVRWHYSTQTGWPVSLLEKLNLSDLVPKWPQKVLALGEAVGGLTPEAAAHCGLPPGLLVAQGGADAFIGMIGLGVTQPGQMALLTGSSHLQLGLAAAPVSGRGIFGSYTGGLVPGLHVVEGGQTSTGSIVAWFKRVLCAPGTSYDALDAEAAAVAPGCDGLTALDHFQGNRTPHTDAASRGALVGLTLAHGRGHVMRSLMEGVACGTRLILDTMSRAGYTPTSVAIAGGATRSPLWLQIHADVCGVPFVLTRQPEAPLLGCAILAAVAAGAYADIPTAAKAMVAVERVVQPQPGAAALYAAAYARYTALYPALRPLQDLDKRCSSSASKRRLPSETGGERPAKLLAPGRSAMRGVVAPSILAADFARLGEEVALVLGDGAGPGEEPAASAASAAANGGGSAPGGPVGRWIHVDVFDGSQLARGNFTVGPPVVASLRACHPRAFLDVHLCVDEPEKYVDAVIEAGASSVTFHIEAPGLAPGRPDLAARQAGARALAARIHAAGARAGLALSPETPVDAVLPLAVEGEVDMVLAMTVTPGWGGQSFKSDMMDKVRALRAACPRMNIEVDGGITAETAPSAVEAGANILVAGTCVFRSPAALKAKANTSTTLRVAQLSQVYEETIRAIAAPLAAARRSLNGGEQAGAV